uniref:Uncharacterized protein n=1 Tax=Tetranychus urticae TaxID=32264 RepID=T1KDU5_TETUR
MIVNQVNHQLKEARAGLSMKLVFCYHYGAKTWFKDSSPIQKGPAKCGKKSLKESENMVMKGLQTKLGSKYSI